MADDDIIPTNSSHSESQTLYVGDVDERTPPMTKIGETNKAANDEDSFVVVDASPANDDEDDDLDLDALLDDSVHDEADADLDALLIDNFDGEGESDAAWKKAEEEAAKAAAAAAQKKAEEEAAKAKAAAVAKKKAEEEAAAATAAALKIAEEETAKAKAEAAKKKAEEEAAAATAAALKIAEEEATKANAAAETEAKKKAEEEAAKVAAEAKAKKKAEEEAAAKAAADAEAEKKAEEEAAAKAAADAEAKKKADEEAAKAKAAAAAKKKSEQEAAKAKAAAETEAKKKAEEEAAKAKAAEARKKAEERAAKAKAIAAAKKKADEEAAAAAEAEARKKAEERAAKAKAAAAAKKKANEEAAKAKAAATLKKAEEKAAKAKAAVEAEAKKKAEEEAAAAVKKAEEEAAAEAEAKKKAEEEAAAKAIEDSHALELDALLDDSDEEDNKDAEPEIFEDNDPSQETSDDKDETNAIEDAHALELDALLDDSDEEDHNNADVEVEEEKPPSRESSTTNKKNANTRQKTNSKASDGGEKAGLPGLASRMSNAIKNTSGKNISSSVSDTLTNSKNKVMTARDRMKEYSQNISNRASNQMRKNTKPNWTESWNSNELRSYMKTTAAFTQNVVEGRIMRQHTVEMREAEVEKDIAFKTRNHVGRPPMKSSLSRSYNQNFSSRATSGTVSSINRVTNTLFERRRKAKERELEMKKCTPNTTPRDGDMGKRTPFSFLISPQKARPNIFREKEESIVFTPEAAKDRSIYHARSYGAHSVASYSSLCTVESFVNPQKAGIAGCQNKYQPLLHNIKGPCELCVFRLSDAEKEELDAKGRHLMVQFTRGGCQDCSAFPKDVGEPPVRLCTKCYNASHRRVPETHSIRRRKKRNGAYYGY